MNVLLLSGAGKIASPPVVDVARELADRGVTVRVAMWAAPTEALLAQVPDTVVWGPVAVQRPRAHEISGSTDATNTMTSTESEVEDQAQVQVQEPPAPTAAPPAATGRPGATGLSRDRLEAAVRWRLLRVRKAVRPYWGPNRARAVRVARRLRRTSEPSRAWRSLRNDPGVLAWARDADVIVAMDSQSVMAAWKLAERSPDASVVYGLSAGRGLITRRLARPTA